MVNGLSKRNSSQNTGKEMHGPAELKLVKRQMYGRAKIDLLQARLIGAT
jgi:hypothetical protein